MGLEGLVSKHKDRPYRARRSPHWDKVKNRRHPALAADLKCSDIAVRRSCRPELSVSYWEWLKLIATAVLISCGTTAAVFAIWLAMK
jgi:hypothetical protein